MSCGNSNSTNPSTTPVKGGGEIDLEDGTGVGVAITSTGGLVDAAAREPFKAGADRIAKQPQTTVQLRKHFLEVLAAAVMGLGTAVVVVAVMVLIINNNNTPSSSAVVNPSSVSPPPPPPPPLRSTVAPTPVPTVAPTTPVPTTGSPTDSPTYIVALSEYSQLTASDGAANDQFGISVALAGDTLVVGARRGEDVNGTTTDGGAVYVFVRSNGTATWTLQAQLTASDGAVDDQFGTSVAIADDTIVVGAYWDDVFRGPDSGSVYVFVRTGTTWTQQIKLTPFDGHLHDWFGTSVAIADDTIVVGAVLSDDVGRAHGSAYVYARTETKWMEQAKLTASDGATLDFFGRSVAIADNIIVVGAIADDDNGKDSGSAYVFTGTGNTWTQQAKLTPSDGAAGDQFGRSVAIAGDTIVVGAWFADGNGTDSGSAYVFMLTGATWTEQAKLTASNGSENDWFGVSVAIAGDTIVVGAGMDDFTGWDAFNGLGDSGSAYVFVRTETSWTQQGQLTASGVASFGISVAIAGDTIGVGAHSADNDSGTQSGSAYVYDLN